MSNLQLTLLALILGVYVTSVVGMPKDAPQVREKRDLLQLGLMLQCSTNRSMWDYNGYGCYCGLGGSGTPLDATDTCCQTHDHCYEKMHTEKTCAYYIEVYTVFYRYTPCSLCSDLSSYSNWIYKFLAGSPECRYRLCQCDSALAACVKKASPTFNPSYTHYNKKTCKQLKRWTDIFSQEETNHGIQDAGHRVHGNHKIGGDKGVQSIMTAGRQHERLKTAGRQHERLKTAGRQHEHLKSAGRQHERLKSAGRQHERLRR
ncbi:phospholipase A2-like [Lineus longissimus]|uniref:phospholipase A2-like n=1 Tax=Lineus longissimus TaxID=88925 RepID=UPI002B4CD5A0